MDCIVTKVVVYNLSASLAGCTDLDIGKGTLGDGSTGSFVGDYNISGYTATTDVAVFTNDDAKRTRLTATETFQICPDVATTGAATVDVAVFGYIYQ